MDIIDCIEIPSFERRRDRFRRNVTVLTGTIALAVYIEKYHGGLSRSLKALKRGLAAAINTWLEDQSGTRLFTLEGDEPPPLTNSLLELSAMGIPPEMWNSIRGIASPPRPAPPPAPALPQDPPHVVVATVVGVDAVVAAAGGSITNDSRAASHMGLGMPMLSQPHPVSGLDAAVATPQFFQSTKFFAVLDVEEARELFSATTRVTLRPHEPLFNAGDSSEAGIFIVVSGQLGVFVPLGSGGPPAHTNTLRYGESVGDLDVVDGAPRTVTCAALDEECVMVQLSRAVFMDFVRAHPRALLLYLQQGLARLWRVAHFMLSDFLCLTLHKPGMAKAPTTGSSGGGAEPEVRRDRLGVQDAGTQTSRSASPPASDSVLQDPTPPPSAPARLDGSLSSSDHTLLAAGSVGTAAWADALVQPPPLLGGELPGGTPSDAEVRAGLQAAADKLSALQHADHQAGRQGVLMAAAPPAARADLLPELNPVGPYCRLQPSPTLRRAFEFGQRACLEDGWDVVDVEELGLSERTWARLTEPHQTFGSVFTLPRGGMLQDVDWACGQFYLLLDGHLLAERQVPAPPGTSSRPAAPTAGAPRPVPGTKGAFSDGFVADTGVIRPGSAISCAAFMSCTAARFRVVALEPARLLAFGWQHLEAMCAPPSTPRPGADTRPLAASRSGTRSGLAGGISSRGSRTTLNSISQVDKAPSRGGGAAAATAPRTTPTPSGTSGAGGAGAEGGVAPDLLEVVLPLLVAAAGAMGPLIRRFISMGLNRVWLKSGDVAYRQGDDASCLYVVISGRLRLLHDHVHHVTGRHEVRVEEEVGRGEAVGVVWTIAGGKHDTTALCVRDSELVRMSKTAFKIVSEDSPMALSKLFSSVARRLMAAWDSRMRGSKVPDPSLPRTSTPSVATAQLDLVASPSAGVRTSPHRSDIVTITIVPAGVMPPQPAAVTPSGKAPRHGTAHRQQPPAGVASLLAVKRLSTALKAALVAQLSASDGEGGGRGRVGGGSTVLVVDSTSIGLRFPVAAERLDVLFYRSKITSWLSAQEEEARFIILEADYHATPWSSVCVAQADVILLVAAEGAVSDMGECEAALVWGAGPPPPVLPGAVSRIPSVSGGMGTSAWGTAHAGPGRRSVDAQAPQAFAAGTGNGLAAPAPTMAQLLHGHDPAHRPQGSSTSAHATSASSNISPLVLAANANAAAVATAATAATAAVSSTAASAVAAAAAVSAGSGVSANPHPAPQPVPPIAGGQSGLPPTASVPTSMVSSSVGPAVGSARGVAPGVVRRIELVLLHPSDTRPSNTEAWLAQRPHLTRHHHVRLDQEKDVGRLARWMRGRAVGLVLSGGGSRGLAHLGVLCALEDAGIPVDVVGGTSQGAFMAGLYAQGLAREPLQAKVQQYAKRLGSVQHLMSDLTLPILSVFSGKAFDDMLQKTFEKGAGNIEDLWLPFFCVSTNLSRGEPSVHTKGCLWRLVRASMTIVGLLPPVCTESGDLLVDGGYMNNIPVDVMRGLGVDTVIVVDVEGKDEMGWHSLTPYDGGISGWRLLWDRWCPVPSWRSSIKIPRYAQIMNQLTWMTHAHNLKRVNEDYRIDLYLRPPHIGSYKLMDFHLMERIVKDTYRYATLCLANWSALPSVSNPDARISASGAKLARSTAASSAAHVSSGTQQQRPAPGRDSGAAVGAQRAGRSSAASRAGVASSAPLAAPQHPVYAAGAGPAPPSASIACMSQLQNKQEELEALAGARLEPPQQRLTLPGGGIAIGRLLPGSVFRQAGAAGGDSSSSQPSRQASSRPAGQCFTQ